MHDVIDAINVRALAVNHKRTLKVSLSNLGLTYPPRDIWVCFRIADRNRELQK